jgi:hypothetical protein
MIVTSIIFFIAIVFAFGMLTFRAWELRKGHAILPSGTTEKAQEFSFRQLEKYMLYLTKRAIQWIVLVVVKYWFIALTKFKKWVADKWPRVHAFFAPTPKPTNTTRPSYMRRAVVESKIKIRRVKEKVKREHAEKVAEKEAEVASVQTEIPESVETIETPEEVEE